MIWFGAAICLNAGRQGPSISLIAAPSNSALTLASGSCAPTWPITMVRVRIKPWRTTAPSLEKSSPLHAAGSAPFPRSAGSMTATSASPDRGQARPRPLAPATGQMAKLSGRFSAAPSGISHRAPGSQSANVANGRSRHPLRPSPQREASADEVSNRDKGPEGSSALTCGRPISSVSSPTAFTRWLESTR